MELSVIPAPQSVTLGDGAFVLTAETAVSAPEGRAAAELTGLLRTATGFPLPLAGDGAIALIIEDGPQDGLDAEAYRLESTPAGVTITASTDEGLFRGVQTLRQLLPAAIESAAPVTAEWIVPAVTITDAPRFPWRGVLLDVARHFFDVAAVKRFIDRLVPYKLNILHLHLTDDQGWRLEIPSHPKLTSVGAATQVGGGAGGFFSREGYAEILAYAADRYITVVPEIDLPGHTQAAMAAYPSLAPSWPLDSRVEESLVRLLIDRDGRPVVYTGTEVGFSEIAIGKDETYAFLRDVLGSVAAQTPGGYLHIGGDEALKTTPEDYAEFLQRVLPIVPDTGKTVVAWQEAAASGALPPGTRLQYWRPTTEPVPEAVGKAAGGGVKLIMSPADRAYLDLKYDESTPLGLTWAGTLGVERSYDWDPADPVPGADVVGVEAALWSETLSTPDDLDFMLYPRLPGLAEVAWSAPGRDWDAYRARLAAHPARWDSAGITNYFRSSEL
ncbi:beta-N-acetylhexosaminidase [Actinocorallia longicatena]|uniref:beta-N-acetylhexosaminidase n=1 Tax=Actinocorallia longicatena TaxID=111803 RepID=A0ABP6QHT5_9ACTN